MTVTDDNQTQAPQQPTREQIKRQLVDAYAASEAADREVERMWQVVDARGITVDEFSAALNADDRVLPAHPTTWGRRKNRALGIKDYRSDDPTVQRRRRPKNVED